MISPTTTTVTARSALRNLRELIEVKASKDALAHLDKYIKDGIPDNPTAERFEAVQKMLHCLVWEMLEQRPPAERQVAIIDAVVLSLTWANSYTAVHGIFSPDFWKELARLKAECAALTEANYNQHKSIMASMRDEDEADALYSPEEK